MTKLLSKPQMNALYDLCIQIKHNQTKTNFWLAVERINRADDSRTFVTTLPGEFPSRKLADEAAFAALGAIGALRLVER